MPHILAAHGYELDFDVLYARLWDLAENEGDGSRVYTSAGEIALKWLIADLAGTPAEPGRTLPANNELRKQVHAALLGGLAERVNERRFRLLVLPESRSEPGGDSASPRPGPDSVAGTDPDDDGTSVQDVDVAAVTAEDGRLGLGGLEWSTWTPLQDAATTATTTPGVYAARSEGQLVYIGMAGERRGQGVRGRLRVYARGRGAVSGLGEAVLDRALADPVWLQDRLVLTRGGMSERATAWAKAAFGRRLLEVAWAGCQTAAEARAAEHAILVDLEDADLWNRARPRRS